MSGNSLSRETSQSPDDMTEATKVSARMGKYTQPNASNYATVIINPIQVQLNGLALPIDAQSNMNQSPNSLVCSSEQQSSPQHSTSAADKAGQRLSPDRDASDDLKPLSPVPDGYHTPTFPLASYYYSLLNVPHVPYTGYTAVTIPSIQPPLPEKKRFSSTAASLNGHNALLRVSSDPSKMHHVTFSPTVGEQTRGSASQHSCSEEPDIRVNATFVQDSSKYWYKPGISRDQGEDYYHSQTIRIII